MYDIHCHVLPGIDNGARSIEDSMEMSRYACSEGVNIIIATPHFIGGEAEVDKSRILSQVLLLNKELKRRDINLLVLPGMEVYLTDDIDLLYDEGKVIPLNMKNYMMIELPMYYNLPSYFEKVIFNLRLKGIRPVIAHPEKSKIIIEHPNIIYGLIERQCYIQINGGSLTGIHGRDAEKTANLLLEHNMVHAIGSDNHTRGSMTSMKSCYDYVERKFGAKLAEDLFVNNGYSIIHGKKIKIKEPVRIRRKKFWII